MILAKEGERYDLSRASSWRLNNTTAKSLIQFFEGSQAVQEFCFNSEAEAKSAIAQIDKHIDRGFRGVLHLDAITPGQRRIE
jgi:hypothetical protein